MADVKVTDLTELAAIPASNDLLMVVDVSDTTMSAAGTNKKIAASYFVNSSADKTFVTGDGTTGVLPVAGTVPVVSRANTFTAVQGFTAGFSFGGSNATLTRAVTNEAMLNNKDLTSIASNGTQELATSFQGMLLIIDNGTGRTGLFLITGGVLLVAESTGGAFSTTKDNASSVNVYVESTVLTVQNKHATGRAMSFMLFGREP